MDEIHVWLGCTRDLSNRIDSFRSVLTEGENQKANRFRFLKDRVLFTLARGSLRLILGRFLNQPPAEIRLEYTHHGKPLLADDCKKIQFNVSHSGECFLIAISGHPVGIDIEIHRPFPHLKEIARRFFAQPEWSHLETLEEQEQITCFFQIWTRKEAFIKGVGQGLSFPLGSFTVLDPSGKVGFLRREDGTSQQTESWFLQDLEAPGGYSAAVASQEGQYPMVSHPVEDLLTG